MPTVIVLQRIDNQDLFCPVLICDVCGKPIENRRLGAMGWFPILSYGVQTPAMIVHKGDCLNRLTQSGYYWDELREHYRHVLNIRQGEGKQE